MVYTTVSVVCPCDWRSKRHSTEVPTCVQPGVLRAESNTAPDGRGPCLTTTPVAGELAVFFTPIVYVAVFCAELVPNNPDDEREEEDREEKIDARDELLEPA